MKTKTINMYKKIVAILCLVLTIYSWTNTETNDVIKVHLD